MNAVILDASALLAFIRQETGASEVEKYAPAFIMSAVNVAEASAVLQRGGMTAAQAKDSILSLVPDIQDFTLEQGFKTADLEQTTKHLGLSFGDRACLALGQSLKLPVLTSDTAWKQLANGQTIKFIR